MVDLPLPDGPTSAVTLPGGKKMETSRRLAVYGRAGYANVTWSSAKLGSYVGRC